jgi:hypothetical protein
VVAGFDFAFLLSDIEIFGCLVVVKLWFVRGKWCGEDGQEDVCFRVKKFSHFFLFIFAAAEKSKTRPDRGFARMDTDLKTKDGVRRNGFLGSLIYRLYFDWLERRFYFAD